jgi:hypothetical protein
LAIFNHFFEAGSDAGTCNVTEVLLHTLRDYLPDRLAQKRWRAVLDRLSEGAFRRRVQSYVRPLVTSPLPTFLAKIHVELRGVRRKEPALRLAPYVRILDDLTAAYEKARSIDEGFLLLSKRIAAELERIRELMGGTDEIDAAASVYGPVSLAKLLHRIFEIQKFT